MYQTITLACAKISERLYLTNKNKRNTPKKLRLKKYPPRPRRRALFTEVK